MFRKKLPVLTAKFCKEIEDVRLALEVLSGLRVCLGQVDFNTGRGFVRVGAEGKNISFFFGRNNLLQFSFWNEVGEPKEWYTAWFEATGEARVIKDFDNPYKRGVHSMWWVGRSAIDRWEEPLFYERVEYCAKIRGMSVAEYLNTAE